MWFYLIVVLGALLVSVGLDLIDLLCLGICLVLVGWLAVCFWIDGFGLWLYFDWLVCMTFWVGLVVLVGLGWGVLIIWWLSHLMLLVCYVGCCCGLYWFIV